MNFLLSTFKMFRENEDDTILSTESLSVPISSKVQVFLRIRPLSSDVRHANKGVIYQIQDSTTLLVKQCSASDLVQRSKLAKLSDNANKKKFTFSKIFNLEIDQSTFFDETIKPAVIDFLNNQSTTIISYGTADSGKSYTLFGSLSEPGLISRSIELIFSTLNNRLTPWYKPKRFNSVTEINENDRLIEMDIKDKLVSYRLADKSMYEEAYKVLENSGSHENLGGIKESMYSVWISFIEIYNDIILDLLEVDMEGKNLPLKLVTDKNGYTYVQGIRNICATNGLEAYEIFNAGQTKLSTLPLPNYKSSRSHSIFTIKLFKYEKYSTASEVEVSSITFCDLAGTGRIQKSLDSSKQLKESKSINTSLLALGKCFKAIAAGHSRQSTAPFRDSKLTRLLQHSLCGKENVSLLINVNPSPELYAETQNVLSFASIAMKISTETSKDDKKCLDNEILDFSSKSHINQSLIRAKTLSKQEIDDLILKNQKLLAEIKELKSTHLKKEFEIRDELTKGFKKQLRDLEENWKNRITATKKEYESLMNITNNSVHNYYRTQIDQFVCRKNSIDRGDCDILTDAEIVDIENSQENKQLNQQKNENDLILCLLKSKINALTEIINLSRKHDENNQNDKKFGPEKDIQSDEDIMFHISNIQEFVKESIELNKRIKNGKENMLTTEIQCNLEESLIRHLYKEIQDILFPKAIELPAIDRSLNSSIESLDQILVKDNLAVILSRIKEGITSSISKIMKLEIENSDLRTQVQELSKEKFVQENEILQNKIQIQESECARLSLTNTIEDFKTKLKSKEIFENDNSNMIESEHCSINETHGLDLIDHTETASHSFDNDNSSLSLFESDTEKMNNSAKRSSSDSSRNDSGIDCPTCKMTDEKCCQTNPCLEENKHHVFHQRLMQLKLDYNQMEAQHVQESLKVTELSQELESIKGSMAKLKANNFIIEQGSRKEIDCLKNEKHRLEIRYNEVSQRLQEVNDEYENRMRDLQIKLKVHEEGQSKAAKCLEDYWQNKMNKLEKELNKKTLNENDYLNKIVRYEKDFTRVENISSRVNDFQTIIDNLTKEKIELITLFNEQLSNQLNIKDQFHSLVIKIEDRDKQVLSLKAELSAVIKTNVLNSRKAKELGREVTKLTEKISNMNENITNSEEARRELEHSANKEIDNLRTRLKIFEENAELLNVIYDNNDSNENIINKLKSRLSEKEKELDFIKKNRNTTIERYECMVRQLQDALKMNHHSNKLKKLFPQKHKYFFNELRARSICSIHDSEPQIRDWKLLNDEPINELSCTGTSPVTHSFGGRTKSVSFKEEPSGLMNDISEKSLEAGHRFCSQIYRVPCKEYLLNSQKTRTAANVFEGDSLASRKNCQRKLLLPWKRSFKKYY